MEFSDYSLDEFKTMGAGSDEDEEMEAELYDKKD